MSQSTQLKSPVKTQYSGSANPFARALAETEQSSGDMGANDPLAAFREALMNTKGGTKNGASLENFQNKNLKDQQTELLKQQKLRQERHAQINPVDLHEVYHARQIKVKQQIEETRAWLKNASQQLQNQDQQVYNTLNTQIPEEEVGEQGSYLSAFYYWLEEKFSLWMKNAKSGNDWLDVGKKKKGLQAGNKNNKAKSSVTTTKNVQSSFHHEKSMNGGAG